MNNDWITKCVFQVVGGITCCEFEINIPFQITWERYQAQRIIATSLIRFAKKSFYEIASIDLSNPESNCKKWWSFFNSVRGRENSSSIPTGVENEVPIFYPKGKGCILLKLSPSFR